MSYFDVHVNPGSITFMQAGVVPGLSPNHVNVRFIRTLRLPDDGKTYPLPPGIGTFPVKRVDDYKDRVPPSWVEHGGVFLPMYQREALWLSFFSALRESGRITQAAWVHCLLRLADYARAGGR